MSGFLSFFSFFFCSMSFVILVLQMTMCPRRMTGFNSTVADALSQTWTGLCALEPVTHDRPLDEGSLLQTRMSRLILPFKIIGK